MRTARGRRVLLRFGHDRAAPKDPVRLLGSVRDHPGPVRRHRCRPATREAVHGGRRFPGKGAGRVPGEGCSALGAADAAGRR
ncbi:hypothetical protein GZL_08563 [Streptomyces sp. 769]|nr:hypothetical protein GZL_08563 [Streptomyces sp. 769]